MFIRRRRAYDLKGGAETPEAVLRGRRRLLGLGLGAAAGAIGFAGSAGYLAWRRWRGSDEQVLAAGVPATAAKPRPTGDPFAAVAADERFRYGRPETHEPDAARWTNFYEFSVFKWVWKYVDAFQTEPWRLRVGGLCRRPLELDMDDLYRRFGRHLVERQYRHRCVETWAMCVPWIGIPLGKIIEAAEPLASATHVLFRSFYRPREAPGFEQRPELPWPYQEGLTLGEATNELTLLATGMYGHPLLKQHGAPVRLAVPWKYGYKSIKSIVRIEFVPSEPPTFWNTVAPAMYPFESNVDPRVARPWPQTSETMLGTGERFATELYNGYGEYVASLYE